MKKVILATTSVLALSACSINFAPNTYTESGKIKTKTVVYDEGGFIDHREDLIEQLNKDGTKIEIRGACMSSCTMFLGADNVCVTPNSYFGFHGAMEFYFVPATPEKKLEYDSALASYYPPNLKEWFMKKGRNIILFWYTMSGKDLKEMDPEHIQYC